MGMQGVRTGISQASNLINDYAHSRNVVIGQSPIIEKNRV
jgi:hypothetical protein